MIRLGAYKKGTDSRVDLFIGYFIKIEELLKQRPDKISPMHESYKKLGNI